MRPHCNTKWNVFQGNVCNHDKIKIGVSGLNLVFGMYVCVYKLFTHHDIDTDVYPLLFIFLVHLVTDPFITILPPENSEKAPHTDQL